MPHDGPTSTPDTTDPTTTNPLFTREEIDRIKANRAAVAEHFAARRDRAEAWVSLLEWLEDDVITPLTARWKTPFQPGWEKSGSTDWDGLRAALTESEINAGLVLGPSRRVAFDADNAAGTEALLAAGHHIHHVSPGSRHPDHDHAGGCTALHRLPSWVPDVRLTGPTTAVLLDNGGKFDVLAGNHQVVLPLSVVQYEELDGFSGRYMTASEAGLVPEERDGWAIEASGVDLILPLWALSEELLAYAPEGEVTPEALAVPAGLEALAGTISIWAETERTYDPADRDELTEKIDDLDLLSLLEEAGVEGQRRGLWSGEHSGCELWLRHGSNNSYSLVVHNGCHMGYVVMVFTTGIPTLPAGGHSRLDAYIGLLELDIATHRGSVMNRLGLIKRPSGGLVEGYERDAERYEHAAETGDFSAVAEKVMTPDGTIRLDAAAYCLEQARLAREQARIIQASFTGVVATGQPVETHSTGAAWGSPAAGGVYPAQQAAPATAAADPEPVQVPTTAPQNPVPPQMQAAPTPGEQQEPLDVQEVPLPGQAAPGAEMDVDDAIEGELVGGVDTDELEKVVRDLRGKIVVIETMMRDLTPGTRRIHDYAESQGVYPHGLTCALLGRAMAGVPPNVVLPPRNGNCSHKVLGSGVNIFTSNVAVSSAGKGETENAAEAAIPLPLGVAAVGVGTSEYWSKQLRGVVDGKPQIKTTSLYAVVDEMDTLNAYLSQPGNKMPGWLTSTYQNGYGGQGTSDEKNSASLPKHGSRIGIHINSQFEKMAVLSAHDAIGAEARFILGNAGIVDEGDEGPLFGITVPPVMADQSSQPWYNPGHVADPPAACQQSQATQAAIIAAGGAPTISGLNSHRAEDGEEVAGHRGFDDAAPIWIPLPPKAQAAVKEARRVSAALAKDPTLALKQKVSAHRLMVRLHAMVGFAVIDGLWQPTDDHWDAADLLVHGSDLVAEACRAYIKLKNLTAQFEAGEEKGAMYAGSKAAEVAITGAGVESAMLGILDRLQRAGGSAKPRDIRNGVKGRFGGLSKGQQRHMRQAFAKLEQAKQIYLATDGSWNLGQPPAAVAA
ncbi:bifunctional DNA primase/polymerase [Mycobacteroides abscessus subsp. abscessus]|nr:bifunctional DNA primase/polymerase [Mycobacteroides abscessus]MBN7461896.1 bifunctional DNA primase/polymerase [Mycobacteroides abscessus subsp. abscessus]